MIKHAVSVKYVHKIACKGKSKSMKYFMGYK